MQGEDWFYRLTGLVSDDFASVQQGIVLEAGNQLYSLANHRCLQAGYLSLPALADMSKPSDTGRVRLQELVADAVQHGATVITGGKPSALGHTFYEPTILGNATTAMRIAKEEVFGPVAPVFRFKTEEEAIQMANDTEFGLAAYFYARDVGRVWRVGDALEYGMLGINSGVISTAVAPFGGVKQSGMGREGGAAGLEEYVSTKYRCMAF